MNMSIGGIRKNFTLRANLDVDVNVGNGTQFRLSSRFCLCIYPHMMKTVAVCGCFPHRRSRFQVMTTIIHLPMLTRMG